MMTRPDLKPAVHATALKLRGATAASIIFTLQKRWPRLYIPSIVRYYLERLVAEGNLYKERIGKDVFYLAEEIPDGNS